MSSSSSLQKHLLVALVVCCLVFSASATQTIYRSVTPELAREHGLVTGTNISCGGMTNCGTKDCPDNYMCCFDGDGCLCKSPKYCVL